jgi:hypothetical protein
MAFWILIYYHDASTDRWFDSTTFLRINNAHEYEYSCICSISSEYQINGSYEFFLEYPGLVDYNRWFQSKNLFKTLTTDTPTTIGYKFIYVDYHEKNKMKK